MQYIPGFFPVGRDSSVGIAIRYGLDDPGIESRWKRGFSLPVQTGSGAHPASYTMGTGSFTGVMRPGHGVHHPPPCSAEVKVRVKLYLYSPFWAFVALSRVNFTFTCNRVQSRQQSDRSVEITAHLRGATCLTPLRAFMVRTRNSSTRFCIWRDNCVCSSHFNACMCTAMRTVSQRAVFTRDSPDTDTQFQTAGSSKKTARKYPVPRRTLKPLKHCEGKQQCTNYVRHGGKKEKESLNWWSYTSAVPTPVFYLSPHKYNAATRNIRLQTVTMNRLVARYAHILCPPQLFA